MRSEKSGRLLASRQPWFRPMMAFLLVTVAYLPGGPAYLITFPSMEFLQLAAPSFDGPKSIVIPAVLLAAAALATTVILCESPVIIAIWLGTAVLRAPRPPDCLGGSMGPERLHRGLAKLAIVLGILHVATFLLLFFTYPDALAVL